MTVKEYTKDRLNKTNTELERVTQQLDQKSKVYGLIGGLCGVLALGLLSTPWIAIPMGGFALSWLINRNYYKRCLGAEKKRLEAQKNHLVKTSQTGVDCSGDTMKKRKGAIDKLSASYKKQQEDYNNSCRKMNVANTVAAVTTAAACLFPGTLLALAALGTIGYKYLSDNEVATKKEEVEDACLKLTNLSDVYNVGVYTLAARNGSPRRGSTATNGGNAKTRSATRRQVSQPKMTNTDSKKSSSIPKSTTTSPKIKPFKVGGTSKADEAVVDAYIRSLENKGSNEKGFQKRKI